MKQNQKFEQHYITSIKISTVSHIYGEKCIHKSPLHLWFYAIFQTDNSIDNYNIADETYEFFNQNHVYNAHYIISELNDVSQNGNYESLLGFDNVDSTKNETIRIKKR